jgi:hypothetical protein
MSLSRKQVPAYLMLIVVALAGLTGAMVAFAVGPISQRSVTTINGEVFTLTGELTVGGFSTSIAPQTLSAVGTVGTPVVMATPSSNANTIITKGDYTYSMTVTIFTSAPDTVYKVTLKQDGTSVTGSPVYIKQDAAGTPTYTAIVTWDIGTTLQTAVYEVDIVPAS